MTEFERSIFGPPDDTPILPWYQGQYTHAFIALHPFFFVEGVDPAKCDYGTLILSGYDKPDDLNLVEWSDQERVNRRTGKQLDADDLDLLIKPHGISVSWQEVANRAEFNDHRELNRALRTSIDGLKPELSDPIGCERLLSYCARSQLFRPTEGMFQERMESKFVELFARTGYTTIVMADEFGPPETEVQVIALDTVETWRISDTLTTQYPRRLFTDDRSLLISTHWDSFFTIILGKRKQLSDIAIGDLFEGFWASDETTIGWLFEPLIPLV